MFLGPWFAPSIRERVCCTPPRMLHGWLVNIRGQLDAAKAALKASARLIGLSRIVQTSYFYTTSPPEIRQARRNVTVVMVTSQWYQVRSDSVGCSKERRSC